MANTPLEPWRLRAPIRKYPREIPSREIASNDSLRHDIRDYGHDLRPKASDIEGGGQARGRGQKGVRGRRGKPRQQGQGRGDRSRRPGEERETTAAAAD